MQKRELYVQCRHQNSVPGGTSVRGYGMGGVKLALPVSAVLILSVCVILSSD
jgi:hypothetical protein